MDKEAILKILSSSESSERETQLMSLISQLSSLGEDREVIDIDEYVVDLQRRNTNLGQKHTFKVGDIVRWKEGLKNRKVPNEKLPAIVVEVLDKPIYDEKAEVGSTYFREPLDIILGMIIKGDLITFHYDSRRFEPFEKNN